MFGVCLCENDLIVDWTDFRFAIIVASCHDDTYENVEDAPSLAKFHAFSMSRPIKQHITMQEKTKYFQ